MAKVDFSGWSVAELTKARDEIDSLITKKTEEDKQKLLEKFKAEAEKQGFSLDDILGKSDKSVKPSKSVKPKYRNPDNPSDIWSGRGRKPKWFEACLEAGKTEEDLLIK